MAGKNTAAFGIYSNEATAAAAVDRLIAGGFSNDDVSVLMMASCLRISFPHSGDT
jgi:hypothetical protein